MYKKSFLLIMLFALCGVSSFAHALWIQTDATAVKGQKHSIEILWAEDGKTELMPIDKWFSDMKDFTLYLTTPDGKEQQIAVTANGDRYTASFTPDKEGVYILSLSHTAKDFGDAKLEYNAEATVTVGKVSAGTSIPSIDNELKLTGDFRNSYKKGKTISLSYLLKNTAKDSIQVEVFSPEGWNKTFETDGNGSIELPLLWSGRYAVEAVYYAEGETGTYNNKPYKAVRHCATYTFDSNP